MTEHSDYFASVRLERVSSMRDLQAASIHANRLDTTSQLRLRPGADSSLNLAFHPWRGDADDGRDVSRRFDYVGDFKAMKAQTGVRERGNTAPVSHCLCQISTGWVRETGDLHDPKNPRNVLLFETAIAWGRELFGADAVLAARMDLDETGGALVDLLVTPSVTGKKGRPFFSVSPCLKELQAKYKQRKSFNALQDHWAGFVQTNMDPAIKRGNPKIGEGPDRLTPEAYGERAEQQRRQAQLDADIAAHAERVREFERRTKEEGERQTASRAKLEARERASDERDASLCAQARALDAKDASLGAREEAVQAREDDLPRREALHAEARRRAAERLKEVRRRQREVKAKEAKAAEVAMQLERREKAVDQMSATVSAVRQAGAERERVLMEKSRALEAEGVRLESLGKELGRRQERVIAMERRAGVERANLAKEAERLSGEQAKLRSLAVDVMEKARSQGLAAARKDVAAEAAKARSEGLAQGLEEARRKTLASAAAADVFQKAVVAGDIIAIDPVKGDYRTRFGLGRDAEGAIVDAARKVGKAPLAGLAELLHRFREMDAEVDRRVTRKMGEVARCFQAALGSYFERKLTISLSKDEPRNFVYAYKEPATDEGKALKTMVEKAEPFGLRNLLGRIHILVASSRIALHDKETIQESIARNSFGKGSSWNVEIR